MAPAAEAPLAGREVVITRAPESAAAMQQQLESLGAAVRVEPAIEVVYEADRAGLARALASAAGSDWVVFTSRSAVEAVFAAATDDRWRAGARLAAVGPSTASALESRGMRVDRIAQPATAEGLLDAFEPDLQGVRILMPRARDGRDLFPDGARERGAEVTLAVAYRTEERRAAGEALRVPLERRAVDAIVFASPSAVRAVLGGLGPEAARLLRPVLLACVGPTTRRALEDAGIAHGEHPARPDADALVALILERLGR